MRYQETWPTKPFNAEVFLRETLRNCSDVNCHSILLWQTKAFKT